MGLRVAAPVEAAIVDVDEGAPTIVITVNGHFEILEVVMAYIVHGITTAAGLEVLILGLTMQ